jgi:hypothetical protein
MERIELYSEAGNNNNLVSERQDLIAWNKSSVHLIVNHINSGINHDVIRINGKVNKHANK